MVFERKAAFIYACITITVVSAVVGAMLWREQNNQQRLVTGPHIPGKILSFWFNKGTTRAVIEFTRHKNGEPILCRTEVTLTTGDVRVGQSVSVVARPDSCGDAAAKVDS